MAAEIVRTQAGQTSMISGEITDALNKTYDALRIVKAEEKVLSADSEK